jgi:hypothetical protein
MVVEALRGEHEKAKALRSALEKALVNPAEMTAFDIFGSDLPDEAFAQRPRYTDLLSSRAKSMTLSEPACQSLIPSRRSGRQSARGPSSGGGLVITQGAGRVQFTESVKGPINQTTRARIEAFVQSE